jgi:hypothetical protein
MSEPLSNVNVIGLEFPYIKLNLDGICNLTPAKPANSQTGILLKIISKGEKK